MKVALSKIIEIEPDEKFWVLSVSPEEAPDKPEFVEIEFEAGEAVALNGKKMSPKDLLVELNKIGGRKWNRPLRHGRKPFGRHEISWFI
jgi:argininosuccinate synthase